MLPTLPVVPLGTWSRVVVEEEGMVRPAGPQLGDGHCWWGVKRFCRAVGVGLASGAHSLRGALSPAMSPCPQLLVSV